MNTTNSQNKKRAADTRVFAQSLGELVRDLVARYGVACAAYQPGEKEGASEIVKTAYALHGIGHAYNAPGKLNATHRISQLMQEAERMGDKK